MHRPEPAGPSRKQQAVTTIDCMLIATPDPQAIEDLARSYDNQRRTENVLRVSAGTESQECVLGPTPAGLGSLVTNPDGSTRNR
jgi:hypothetical protein